MFCLGDFGWSGSDETHDLITIQFDGVGFNSGVGLIDASEAEDDNHGNY